MQDFQMSKISSAMGVTPARAARPFNDNTTADTIDLSPGEGVCADAGDNCSLRAAILEANTDPGSTIQFDGSLNGTPIVFTRPGNDYTANSGDLDINASTTITGNGASNTFIGGDGDGKADPGETIRYTTAIMDSAHPAQ